MSGDEAEDVASSARDTWGEIKVVTAAAVERELKKKLRRFWMLLLLSF